MREEEDNSSHIKILEGDEIKDRGYVFKGYYANVTSYEEVKNALDKIKHSRSSSPDHNIYTFNTEKSKHGMFHDGELN